MTRPELLLLALTGGLLCAILAAALAPFHRNDPRRSAIGAFFVGLFVLPAVVVVAAALGWWV